MHHLYPTSTGDPLCPLGFHPQVRWPTRCKRCFRDYKDHKDPGGKKSSKDATASSPSLSIWKQTTTRSTESNEGNGRSWASTSSLVKDEETNAESMHKAESASAWCSAMDLSSLSLSDLRTQEPEVTVTIKPTRPKTYAGCQSDTYNFRRFSMNESPTDGCNQEPAAPQSKHKLQIKNVIDKSNGTTSNNDAEFIIQVRKSRITERIGANAESTEKEMLGGKTENQEDDKVKTQLSDMRARCERLEKEKAEILLRRLSTMDSTSLKSWGTDVLKLQKTVKDLQSKNDTLTEERTSLVAKIKSLEKELNLKTHKNERERANEELRSKLKAAEMLCESLMDENEDMKKEIRELEEEIYEMQDNFREEQVDEYTTIRKNLEQSNKNCRILSFKLRKIERKAEQLEADKTDLEKKYEQIKKIEDILKKIGTEYKNRSIKKLTEYPQKMQLEKLISGIEKDIGDVISAMLKMIDGRESGIVHPNFKYDKLCKEHEQLKEKYNKTLNELTHEKEKKTRTVTTVKDSKNEDLANLKKKLEESQASRELERKSWDTEKVKLQEEKEKFKSKLLSLSADKLKVYNEVVQLKKDLEVATSSKKETARMEILIADLRKEVSQEKDRNKKLHDDLSTLSEKESKLARSLTTVETVKIQLENDLKQTKLELENTKNTTSTKVAKVTTELSILKKEKEKLHTQLEKEKQNKDLEIASLQKKNLMLEKASLISKKMENLKQSYDEKISNLENDMKNEVQKFNDLKDKQEKLSESKLQLEKENQLLNGQLLDHKQDCITLQAELQEVRQFYKSKEMEWSAQKLRLERQLHEYEKTAISLSQADLREENLRLKKESSSLTQQIEDLKKANDDLSSKLQDYTHVAKIQRNFSTDSSVLESELKKAKNTAANAEKARKADLAQCKLRYEQRVAAIGDEIKSIQAQLTRYKRERDTYKQMLEGAQKSIAELKSTRPRKSSTSSIGKSDEDEEVSNATRALLEKQIVTIEDELSEAKLEASKLKTEIVSEKSASEIKLSEMQSRINELEEERLLASGRTKMPGMKVRMELAWQKEREDQQRLLQETATLARDLRQTLFEVERERDKERLENKRRQDQLKKIFDEEKDENKKKLIELQCDLLELRDAHAKLRTSNEKMRREKERQDREREDLRGMLTSKRRQEQTEARNLNILLQQVDDLMRLFPEINGVQGQQSPEIYTPTPPRRLKGPKSRESSPMLDSKDDSKTNLFIPTAKTEKLEYTINKLMEVAKELQESKRAADESATRSKKLGKRSSSIDNTEKNSISTRSKPSLKRKSLSLEQTSGKHEQSIWRNNSNVSSLQSLNGSDVDNRHYNLQRDSSIESHLSNESTKSEILRHEKKYSKGIIRRITTKLTKSASVEDSNSSLESSLQTSASETSLIENTKKDKKNLKKKLSNMFKRSSKSNGLDKKLDSKDNSRPSSRNSTVSSKL
ncbi:PREDICTED: protein MLP1 [Ceratosolen solmsi marchali]|uniref:Protein MLP1 n=1 Tax=Ceratosolen solmsi marchali TaxID=326594 RepID=A0AAJ6YE38_9HYME|nr:PREDICTED: protein MLP1 [Ceratosolen solmsi marchali]